MTQVILSVAAGAAAGGLTGAASTLLTLYLRRVRVIRAARRQWVEAVMTDAMTMRSAAAIAEQEAQRTEIRRSLWN